MEEMNGASAADVTDGGEPAAVYWRGRATVAEARVSVLEKRHRFIRNAVWAASDEPDDPAV